MKIGSINFYNKNNVSFRSETYNLNAREQLFGLNRSLIPDFTFELKEKVDGDRLQDSVKEAIELHPFYKTSLQRKDNGLFTLERNNSTPVVKEYDMETPLTYGTEEFNKFPWLVAYKDKNVIFTASHVIGDGMGVFNFFKTLLRIYFEKGGKHFSNSQKWDYSMVNPEETTKDRYLEFADPKIKGWKKSKNGVEIPEELIVDDKKNTPAYRLTMSKKQLKEKAATTIAPLITYLLSKSLASVLPNETGNISIPIPVNCRGKFSANTDRTFIGLAPLSYDIQQMKDMKREQVERIIRGQLDDALQKKNLIGAFTELSDTTKTMEKNPKLLDKHRQGAGCSGISATLHYTHISNPDMNEDLLNLIDNSTLNVTYPAKWIAGLILAYTFKDDVMLSINNLLKNNMFIDALKETLEREKIKYKLEKLEHWGKTKFKLPENN